MSENQTEAYKSVQRFLEKVSKETNAGSGMYENLRIIKGHHPQPELCGISKQDLQDMDIAYRTKFGGATFMFYKEETGRAPELCTEQKKYKLPEDVAKNVPVLFHEQETNAVKMMQAAKSFSR